MNQYSSTQTNPSILKDSYDGASPLGEALRRKRLKLAESKGVELNSDENNEDTSDES